MSPVRERRVDRCVILRTRPLREADWLVAFLTEQEGRVTGVAPHARRSRRRFGGGLEPGTIGEITYAVHPERDLVGVEDLRPLCSLPAAARELPNFATLGVMLSVVDVTSMERQAAPEKFRLVMQVIEALAHHTPPQVMAYFLSHWLREAGFAPGMETCTRCERPVPVAEAALFAPSDGGMVCRACGETRGWSMPLSAEARQSWLRCVAADGPVSMAFTPALQPFYQQGLWQYLSHVIERALPAAPYWEMIWTAT